MEGKITFNGKNYTSVEKMPSAVREAYQRVLSTFADSDLNGIPDIFEGGRQSDIQVSSSTRIIVDGDEYGSLEEMPDYARGAFEQVMSVVDADHDGVPDISRSGPHRIIESEDPFWSGETRISTLSTTAKVGGQTRRSPFIMLAGVVIAVLIFIILVLVVLLYSIP